MRPLILLLAALVSSAASAQIVNVQAKFAEKPDAGLHGVLSLALDWRTGNTNYLAFKAGLAGSFSTENHALLGVAQGEFGVAKDLSKAFEHLRYRYLASSWLVPEAFLQHEFDQFRLIQLRALGGAGARFNLENTDTLGLSIGLAVMVDYEVIQDQDPTVSPRLSSYVVGRVELMENISLAQTVYFQPRLDRPSGLKVLSQSQLSVSANDHLSISVSVVVAYDTAPPEDTNGDPLVEALDTQVKTALAIKF